MRRVSCWTMIVLASTVVYAAEPPDLMSFQGVLRDSAGQPLDGTYDIVFAFYDADVLGNEILLDSHTGAGAILVTGGLFNVPLGSGVVGDGGGPGVYASLADIFRDFAGVWLEIRVGAETLSPRVRVASAAYALNSTHLGGRIHSEYLNESALPQTKSGSLTLDVSATPGTTGLMVSGSDAWAGRFENTGSGSAVSASSGTLGVEAYGSFAGGFFSDPDTGDTGGAYLGIGDGGVWASGSDYGGYFKDTFLTGEAYLGRDDTGVVGYGNVAGGRFENSTNSGVAVLGSGNVGVEGYGSDSGGYFENTGGSGVGYAGRGDHGLEGYGTSAGGYFQDADNLDEATVATDGYGVKASGTVAGAYFTDLTLSDSGEAYLAKGDIGVEARGGFHGGFFEDTNDTGEAYAGRGDFGLEGYGQYQSFRFGGGGRFEDTLYTGEAYVAHGNEGIYAEGSFAGAEFRDIDPVGAARALVAWSNIGVSGYGIDAGGFFQDDTTGTWTYTALDAQSTAGPGTKNFVQNHPHDPGKVVVYSSLEGDHVGTFTRGSARTEGGTARVALGETFRLVTNPDIGLTAHVTPRGGWSDLYVESITTEEIVVVSRDDSDAEFDYVVYGLRIGFEEFPAIQPKPREARLPAMGSVEQMLERDPRLRASTALERFETMRAERGKAGPVDLAQADALKAAIGTYDPAAHAEPFPEHRGISDAGIDAPAEVDPGAPAVGTAPIARELPAARASKPAPRDVATIPSRRTVLPIDETPSPGDVVAIDPDSPGRLRRTSSLGDPGVFGVVAEVIEKAGDGAPMVSVATAELVEVHADAGFGEIRPGDLLISSPTPGHAMRALDAAPGTILGKALDGLEAGTGTIRVLLTLR